MQHYISDHVKMVSKCEGALTELLEGKQPQVVILCGTTISSGLEELLLSQKDYKWVRLPMESHRSNLSDDSSRAHVGSLEGVRTLVIQGRIHANEEENPLSPMVIPRAAAKAAPEAIFIILNASIGIDMMAGTIALVGDHIMNFAGINPLIGDPSLVEEKYGSRFVTSRYDSDLRTMATQVFSAHKRSLVGLFTDAVYLMAPGPQQPTRAELAFYRSAGAHVVGTPLPEVVALNQMDKRVLGVSIVIESFSPGSEVQPMTHARRVKALDGWTASLTTYLAHLATGLAVPVEGRVS